MFSLCIAAVGRTTVCTSACEHAFARQKVELLQHYIIPVPGIGLITAYVDMFVLSCGVYKTVRHCPFVIGVLVAIHGNRMT
jgi:hypothetical protein